MKQFSVLPSGAQSWYNNVIDCDANGSRFAYSSTLAVYVYGTQNYRLEKLLAAHERTITGLSFCKTNPNFFATCGRDKYVYTHKRTRELKNVSICHRC